MPVPHESQPVHLTAPGPIQIALKSAVRCKRLIPIRLTFTWCLAGLLFIAAVPAQAQESTGIEPTVKVEAESDLEQIAESDLQSEANTISGPHALLSTFGIDAATLASFQDHQDFDTPGLIHVLRILYRLPDFPIHKLQEWADRHNLKNLLEGPTDQIRGEVFSLRGTVTRLESQPVPAEYVERFGFNRFYLAHFQPDSLEATFLVLCRTVPQHWELNQPVEYRASCYGFFLQQGPDLAATGTWVFVTNRLAWHPNTALGDLGMDVGLLDTLRNQAPLREAESEAFYQMLAAVESMSETPNNREPDNQQLIQLLSAPEKYHGQLFSFQGTARRAVEIRIQNPAVVEQLGFDRYYEINVFVDLGTTIKLDDEELSTYPFTLCVRELPKNMPVGERLNESISATAFFFKVWTYESQLLSANKRRQPSPLFIGKSLTLYPAPEVSNTRVISYTSLGILLLAIAGFAFGLWLTNRREKKNVSTSRAYPDKIDLEP